MKIYGIRAIIEAIESGSTLEKIYLQKDLSGTLISKLKQTAKKNNIPTVYVPIAKLDNLADGNHQGAIAVSSQVTYQALDEILEELATADKQVFLVLDGITDVRNYGAILRSAEAAGVAAVVVSESASAPINASTIKTSAGAAFHVPICRVANLKDAIYLFQAYDIQTLGADEKATADLYDMDIPAKVALVMGSEEKGIHPTLKNMLTETYKLPMAGNISSLNVSVAAGISLFEMIRQHR